MKSFSIFFMVVAAGINQLNAESIANKLFAKPSKNANGSPCAELADGTLVPNERNCQKFHLCHKGRAEELSCSTGFYYNRAVRQCVAGTCAQETCSNNRAERLDGDCTAFKVCVRGHYFQGNCLAGKYFDPSLQMCVDIANNPQQKCSCILPEHTVLANPEDCESYYECHSGVPVKHQCQHGFYFNERISACVVDLEGVCLRLPTMSPAELVVLEMCKLIGRDGVTFQAHKGDCAKFHMCINGHVFTERCEKGFYYDNKLHHCRLDVNNQCSKQKIQEIREEHPQKIQQVQQQIGELEPESKLIEIAAESQILKEPIKTADTKEQAQKEKVEIEHENEETKVEPIDEELPREVKKDNEVQAVLKENKEDQAEIVVEFEELSAKAQKGEEQKNEVENNVETEAVNPAVAKKNEEEKKAEVKEKEINKNENESENLESIENKHEETSSSEMNKTQQKIPMLPTSSQNKPPMKSGYDKFFSKFIEF